MLDLSDVCWTLEPEALVSETLSELGYIGFAVTFPVIFRIRWSKKYLRIIITTRLCTFMLFRYFLLRLERLQVSVHDRRCPSMQEVEPFANLIAHHKTDWSCVCESMRWNPFIAVSAMAQKICLPEFQPHPKSEQATQQTTSQRGQKYAKTTSSNEKNSGSCKLE